MGMLVLSIVVAALAGDDLLVGYTSAWPVPRDTPVVRFLLILIPILVFALLNRGSVTGIFHWPFKIIWDHPGSGRASSAAAQDSQIRRGVHTEGPDAGGMAVIECEAPQDVKGHDIGQGIEYPLSALLRLATDVGVEDLATRHDKYAHRMPEQHDGHSK